MIEKGNPAIAVLKLERDVVADSIATMADDIKAAKATLKAFDDALETLGHSLPPVVSPPRRRSRSSGTSLPALVISLLGSKEGLSLDEITLKLADGGRETARPTVTSTLARLKADGLASKSLENNRWYAISGAPSGDESKSSASLVGRDVDLTEGRNQ